MELPFRVAHDKTITGPIGARLAEASRTQMLQSSLPDSTVERYDELLREMCTALGLPSPL